DEAPATADVVIVGGGIVGAATAFFAARAGLRVVVVEQRPRLATLTTPASTGAFRLQFDNPAEIALVREGVELFTAFAERTGLAGWDLRLRQGGYLFCATTEAGLDRARVLVERQRAWGLADVEVLDGDEARRRWPYLGPALLGARYRAGDGWLDPRRLAHGYAAAASEPTHIPDAAPHPPPAAFLVDTPVTRFIRDGDRVVGVETPRGVVHAPWVVVAAGPFTASVASLAGLRLDIRPTRRQKLVVPDLPDIPADAPMTIEDETSAHWRPAMRGCLALWTEHRTPPTPPAWDVPTEQAWAFGLIDPRSDHALARIAPFWRKVWERGFDAWYIQAGQYEYTPDRRPYLGPSPVEGLAINGGYSGHGIMASGGGSRMVVDRLVGRLSADDPPAAAFAVERPLVEVDPDIL
ncbi:MAG TPA: FAD-dependent oxidoreductase, partial [Candidatus Limnocylindrales bacterium]